MATITREYSYHDDGVLPSDGSYGITYLTLYSSNAGNVYDGWIWDPDRINSSEVERTFGYRNPNYPDYCWDDEVVVDLSNPQNREESEFEQGRITSFNTNVSDVPIILQDSGDISGLTEDQRERMATTVLFSAIPLVKDAYIHAEVEVCMKMNISPDNTTGRVRVEAFYILNDNSDRTMRPHPINHFSVSKPDEWNILRLLYWNPNLLHESQNYIGVKLLVTGGTAEIGISDDPEYGDAIITLTSAGLTGDIIDEKRDPVSLEIYGKELVQKGYKLDIDDYQVLCTYSDGQIFEVSRFCNFYPEIGTKIEFNTVLTAEYLGLRATLPIQIARVESINLTAPFYFYKPFTLSLDDVNVIGYLENGMVADLTDVCVYSPAIGSTISQTTELTAGYMNYDETAVYDTAIMTRHTVIGTGENEEDGLIYTLYDDNVIEITGTADHYNLHEKISLPSSIESALNNSNFKLKWAAEGTISGIVMPGSISGSSQSQIFENQILDFIDFDDVRLTAISAASNWIHIDLHWQTMITSDMLSFLNNVDDTPVWYKSVSGSTDTTSFNEMFMYCSGLQNINFMSNWNLSQVVNMSEMFYECSGLENVSGSSHWDVSNVTNMSKMFYGCSGLETVSGSSHWDVSNVTNMSMMFFNCEVLTGIDALWFWNASSVEDLSYFLSECKSIEYVTFFNAWDKTSWRHITHMLHGMTSLKNLHGLEGLDFTTLDNSGFDPYGVRKNRTIASDSGIESLDGTEDWIFDTFIPMWNICTELTDISAASKWNLSGVESINSVFAYCPNLEDLSPISSWDVSDVTDFSSAFNSCDSLTSLAPLADWDTSSAKNMSHMFYGDDNIRYIGCLSGWDVSNIEYDRMGDFGLHFMFARTDADLENDFANTHIIDADSLYWNVPLGTGAHRSKANDGNVDVDVDYNPRIPVYQAYRGGFLYGTDYPAASHRSEKLYPLPDWYGGPYVE